MGKLWENAWLRLIAAIVLCALIFWLCYVLRQILVPLALAFIIAYIFDPVIDVLEKRKIPRGLSIAALLGLILAAIAGSLLVVIPRLIRQTGDLVQYVHKHFPEMQAKLQGVIERFSDSELAETITAGLDTLLASLQSHVPQLLQSMETVLGGIVTRTMGFIGFIANFLLFAVVSVYLLKDFDKITEKARDLIPPPQREAVLGIMGKINENLRSFFRGQIIVCTILAGIYFVGLTIVGVPFAPLIAVVGGYGQIVPYLGTAIAIVPAVVLALIEFGDLMHPLGALLVFVIGQMLEGMIITPKITGEKVGLHPVVIILAILVFGKLLGFLGVIVAVPLAAVLKVIIDEAIARYKRSSLFS